eukprot:3705149-Prymnesium_polylepis.1
MRIDVLRHLVDGARKDGNEQVEQQHDDKQTEADHKGEAPPACVVVANQVVRRCGRLRVDRAACECPEDIPNRVGIRLVEEVMEVVFWGAVVQQDEVAEHLKRHQQLRPSVGEQEHALQQAEPYTECCNGLQRHAQVALECQVITADGVDVDHLQHEKQHRVEDVEPVEHVTQVCAQTLRVDLADLPFNIRGCIAKHQRIRPRKVRAKRGQRQERRQCGRRQEPHGEADTRHEPHQL